MFARRIRDCSAALETHPGLCFGCSCFVSLNGCLCTKDINLHMYLRVQGCNEFKMPGNKYGSSFHSNSAVSKED